MPFHNDTHEGDHPYKFGGKEYDMMHGLDLYDFHARQHDPILGSFTSPDPLAEKYYSISPYAYCANNPVNRIDPDGMDYWSTSDPDLIRQFLNSVGRGSNTHDFTGWNHATDAEFTEKLTYNDETNKFHTSYGTVENGEATVVGISFDANIYPALSVGGGGAVQEPITGFFGNSGYYLFGIGSTYTDEQGYEWNVSKTGYITGLAPIGGIAPTPGMKGNSIWTSTKNINSVSNAFGHWIKHRKEFSDLKNAKQYVEAAKAFLHNSPVGTMTKIRANGDILKYHPSSNTFAVMNASGVPKTMFKPASGIIYWNTVK